VPFANGPTLLYLGRGIYETQGMTDYVGERDVIHIPAGTRTDLASVPRAFWTLIPPHGAWEKAAVLHDHLCLELARCYREGGMPQVNAVDADGLFRRVMREADEVPTVVAWVMYAGVRWGALFNPARRTGWLRWNSAAPTVGITVVLLAAVSALVYGADRLVHWLIP
jgi:Protein of unknown function (DUF1353)